MLKVYQIHVCGKPIIKNQTNDAIIVAMVILLSDIRSSKYEKECKTEIVAMTPSSGKSQHIHNRLHFGILFMEISEQRRVHGRFCMLHNVPPPPMVGIGLNLYFYVLF